MAKADGTIVIDTAIETAGLTAGTKELALACKRAAQSVGDIGSKAQVSLSKALNAVTQQNKAYRAQEERVNALKAKLEEMGTQQVETPEFAGLNTEIEKLTAQLAKADAKKARFLATGGSESSSAFKKMEYDADLLAQALDRATAKKDELVASGGAYTAPDTTSVAATLAAEQEKLGSINQRLNTTFASLITRISGYKSAAKTAGSASKKLGSTMAGGLKTMLKYGLGVRTVYTLVNRLRTALKEGFSNLAQYDNSTNSAISSVSSALLQLKNSFATAFTPILQAVAPILTRFISLLSTAANYVAMFFAALSGKSTYTKAVAVQKDYAASLNNTAAAAKSAKEAQQQLSGLDEMNTWQSQKDSSGGGAGGGGGVAVGDMFETKEVENSIKLLANDVKTHLAPILQTFQNFGARIKESTQKWFEGVDFTPLQTSLAGLLGAFQPLVDILCNSLAWAYENILLPWASWVIEDAAPASIDTLTDAFKLLDSILSPVFNGFMYLWDACLEPIFGWLGGFAVGVINDIGDIFSECADVFKENGDKISEIFEGVGEVFREVWPAIRYILNLFQSVVHTVFKAVGGVISAVISTVIGVLHGLIEFVAGVFTGDWKRAWNGIKEIFTSIWNGVKKVFTALINGIIGVVNGLIRGVVAGLNTVIRALNKLHFNIPDWVPLLGGKSFGFNIGTITAPQIPLLATGAVIPPNAPFTAVLGDQRNGRNLETPEKLLRQIVREESGNGGSYRFVAQLNRRTLFDEMINEAKLRQSSTGKNPFAMV